VISSLRHFHGTFLSGWWRWPTEHFTVFAGKSHGPLKSVRAPFGTYFADPFIWENQGECWLLMEQFLYSKNCGRLVARRLAGGPVIPITLAGPGHASFPCIFSEGDQLYLLPETGNTGTLDLYVCERFPDRWRLVRRMADNLDAADTVPIHRAGRWWFLTSIRRSREDGGHRLFAIFHTDRLIGGDWVAHPINQENRHFDSPFSAGRNAGKIVTLPDGRLLRPFHNSTRYYGENLGWARIDTLSSSQYLETLVTEIPSEFSALPKLPMHHVSTHLGWLACDTRTRKPCGRLPKK